MTFLQGQTTVGALMTKIADLISGAVPDDKGVTTQASHRWRTRFGVSTFVGTSAVDTSIPIAPPASKDRSCTQEHRAGYWMRYDDTCMYTTKTNTQQYARQLTAMTGAWPSPTREAILVTFKVTTANTTPGDYSTARVTFKATWSNSDTYTPTSAQYNAVVAPTADGTVTWTVGANTMTFQIGDPSGTVQTEAHFARWFSDVYRAGIDAWPMAGKNVTGGATFTTPPPGVAGTDYDVLVGPLTWYPNPPNDNDSQFSQYVTQYSTGYSTVPAQLFHVSGLGIKTTAGLGANNRYVASFTWSEAATVLFWQSNIIYAQTGSVGVDKAGTGLRVGRDGSSGGLVQFVSPGATTMTNTVQYWITVTDTHLAIVLNTDTGISWKTTANMFAEVVQDDPTVGSCWLLGVYGRADYWYRLGAHTLIEKVRAGARPSGRDWQTGFGRSDWFPVDEANGFWRGESGVSGRSSGLKMMTIAQGGSYGSYQRPILPPATDRTYSPNLIDQRWAIGGLTLLDCDGASAAAFEGNVSNNYPRSQGRYRVRGTINEGFLLVPTGGFSQGDELTDTATGKKYLLWMATTETYPGTTLDQGSMTYGLALEQV